MKLRISRDANGFLGLYYCRATKELALNLSAGFGVRLRFAMSEKAKNEFCESMLSQFDEQARLSKLNDRELVSEAMKTSIGDDPVVVEMCGRLDPEWLTREDGFTASPWASSDEALND